MRQIYNREQPVLFITHLLSDDHQRVSVLRQEVEDAPDLEGVVVGDKKLALIHVFPGAQSPAHFVEVLTVKVVRRLWSSRTTDLVSHSFQLLIFIICREMRFDTKGQSAKTSRIKNMLVRCSQPFLL